MAKYSVGVTIKLIDDGDTVVLDVGFPVWAETSDMAQTQARELARRYIKKSVWQNVVEVTVDTCWLGP